MKTQDKSIYTEYIGTIPITLLFFLNISHMATRYLLLALLVLTIIAGFFIKS